MKNQTAVEWLEHEIRVRYHSGALDLITISELKMHAKEMEKEQVMQAFYNGTLCDEGFGSYYAEEYYNQQYESEE
jgi:hypothetical protein